MHPRWIPLLSIALCAVAHVADAKPEKKQDDTALTAMMVGTWINPPGSPDFEGVPSRETYDPDGTYTYLEYEDNACLRVSSTTTSKWYVWDGTLVTEYARGKVLKDEIVRMARKKVVLRSLDDNLTYFRLKSSACPTAMRPVRAVPNATH